ncbi:MAG: phospholipase D-like domain-containing protein [Opitutaceae bacterium]
MITITVTETDFFLPEDGTAAQQRFLALLANPAEAWIGAYGFTLQPMFDELAKADARGVPIHVLLDHSQEVGRTEAPKVQALVKSLKHGDVTITTAGINSKAPSQIWHWKGMVAKRAGGFDCWEGSTNFSQSAWLQGNSARVFSSTPWAQTFITQFEAHKTWARQNEPQYQVG